MADPYSDFSLFNKITHKATAAARITAKGHRFPKVKLVSDISRYPQVAGTIFPRFLKSPGSRSTGNIIPDSMIDGRKISWDTMVSFAWFFIASPRTLPIPKDTAIKTASIPK